MQDHRQRAERAGHDLRRAGRGRRSASSIPRPAKIRAERARGPGLRRLGAAAEEQQQDSRTAAPARAGRDAAPGEKEPGGEHEQGDAEDAVRQVGDLRRTPRRRRRRSGSAPRSGTSGRAARTGPGRAVARRAGRASRARRRRTPFRAMRPGSRSRRRSRRRRRWPKRSTASEPARPRGRGYFTVNAFPVNDGCPAAARAEARRMVGSLGTSRPHACRGSGRPARAAARRGPGFRAGDRPRDARAQLVEQPGGEVGVVLAGAIIAVGGEAEAHADPGALRKAHVVGGPGDRDEHDPALGHRRGEVADAAARTQLAPERTGALGEDADAGAGAQRLDRLVERAAVALAALDRDLAHAVEDRRQRPRTSQSVDFARARIWRRWRAATPTATGSMLESWLPAISTGPERGSASSPSTSIRPHHAAKGAQAAIATR